MAAKRKALEQLIKDNVPGQDDEEEQEETASGSWATASKEVMQTRKVVKARRKKQEDEAPASTTTTPATENKDSTPTKESFGVGFNLNPSAWSFNPSSTASAPTLWSFSPPTKTDPQNKEATDKEETTKEESKEKSPSSSSTTAAGSGIQWPSFGSSVITPVKWPSFSFGENITNLSPDVKWPSFGGIDTTFNFTFAPPAPKKEEKEEDEDSGAGDEEQPPENTESEPSGLQSPQGKKNEDEKTEAEVRVRLFEFKKEGSAPGSWQEKGVGFLRVITDLKTHKYRIVMRTDKGLQVILNALPFAGMTIQKVSDKQLKFSCVNCLSVAGKTEQKLCTFLVKLANVADLETLMKGLTKSKDITNTSVGEQKEGDGEKKDEAEKKEEKKDEAEKKDEGSEKKEES